MSDRYHRLKKLASDVGFRAALLHVLHKLFPFLRFHIGVHSPHARFPLWCRAGASDLLVFQQIFSAREYGCFDDLVNPSLIIDCGANIGLSSVYFLNRFPTAFVIAVEPDPGNFAMLQKNLAPYAGRSRAIRSGIWSKSTGLMISEARLGDGMEWGISVRESQPGETAEMTGLNIGDILADSPYKRISLLKIDIEGSENVVFSSDCENWLPKVDNMAIELHGEVSERIFTQAVSKENFILSHTRELTVCRRPAVETRVAPGYLAGTCTSSASPSA
jgi:FkbM family methyltransferase